MKCSQEAAADGDSATQRPRRLTGLDALRGVAALVVLGFHVGTISGSGTWAGGFLAVDFFFVLSGYVLARTYESRMPSAGQFLLLRYKRLWPIVALGTLIGAPLIFANEHSPLVLTLNLALIPAFASYGSFPANGPTWSIFAELVANLLHAAFLWRLPVRALVLVCLGAGSIVVGSQILHPQMINPGPGFGLGILWALPRALFGYSLGIILWRVWQDCPPLKAHWSFALLTLLLAALFGDRLPFAIPIFVLLACPCILAAGLRWQAGSAGMWLGEVSFPLYAFQVPVMQWGRALGVPSVLAAAGCVAFAAVFAAAAIASRSISRSIPRSPGDPQTSCPRLLRFLRTRSLAGLVRRRTKAQRTMAGD